MVKISLPSFRPSVGSLGFLSDIPNLNIGSIRVSSTNSLDVSKSLPDLPDSVFENLKTTLRTSPDPQATLRNTLSGRNLTPKQFAELQALRVNLPPASRADASKAGGVPYDQTAKTASRDTDLADPSNLKAGNKWAPVKYTVAGAVVLAGVIVTAKMISNALAGLKNNGKTFTIISLSNKDSSGNVILCKFKEAMNPNGVCPGDTLLFADTGTFLDGATYTVTIKRRSNFECEFEAEQRLAAEVKNKGTFVYHTTFSNQMDDQTTPPNPFDWLNNLFGGFGESLGAAALPVSIASGVCCALLCLFIIFMFVRRLTSP